MDTKRLHDFFEEKVLQYNQPDFIEADPICIPHRFSQQQDIEISAFFAAIFAWGNRTTIIAKASELMDRMDNAPYDFVMHHGAADARKLAGFKHRTFTEDDLFYFIHFFQEHYQKHATLEDAFARWMQPGDADITSALNGFKTYFFSYEHLKRTRKHISSPAQKSSCKRLNMFLRWMVRRDQCGVDFGLWQQIDPAQLICPLDVHVARVARRFQILQRKPTDWLAAQELTTYLKMLDAADPVRYDFALFAMGVMEKY